MVARNPKPPVDIDAVIRDRKLIEKAMAEARRDALLDHKRTGDPVVVWEDGNVVWVPAEEIDPNDVGK